ncbi:MAG: caspase family protein [Cyanobacteria bacterium P01_F01_bin.150]
MIAINRRHFLQFSGSALGAIGLSQLGLKRRAIHYGKALAQDTPRKIALLIGINDYPLRDRLYGPVTDVELQKQLLIHRFKFHPDNVHTLTDAQATRQGILDAFDEYLFDQVREGDIVVFHYSGHGAQVQEFDRMQAFLEEEDIDCIDDSCQNTTIVPVDYSGAGPNAVQDIMGHTLFLMRSALPTDNVTFVLDCCYSGGGKRGNVIMRSRVTDLEIRTREAPQIIPQEWEVQERWLSHLKWSPRTFIDRIGSPEGKGFVVTSAKQNQQSADYAFNGFNAGAFTYLLTQYLWQETEPLSVSQTVTSVARSTTRLSQHSQIPEYDPVDTGAVRQQPIFHIPPESKPAEAVILEHLGNNRVKLWLGGLDPQSLVAFDNDAVFTLIDDNGDDIGQVQQNSPRDGLTTTGKILRTTRSTPPQGILLQEHIRQIPNTIKLSVGFDDTLSAEEQAIATPLLQRYDYLDIRPLQSGTPVSVLIGRLTLPVCQRLQRANVPNLPPLNSIGLFTATQEPINAIAFGPPDEPIESLINTRLVPQLKSLLIGRMLALMVNQNAARLKVNLSIDHNQSRSVTRTRGETSPEVIVPVLSEQGIESIPVGDLVTITVQNNESQNLHIGLLVIDATGDVTVLSPPASDDPNIDIVEAGQSIVLGPLRAIEPHGLTELLVIASTHPLQSALRILRRVAANRRDPEIVVTPDEVMGNVFGALDSRRSGETGTVLASGTRSLDVNQVAALSLLYEVTPSQSSEAD